MTTYNHARKGSLPILPIIGLGFILLLVFAAIAPRISITSPPLPVMTLAQMTDAYLLEVEVTGNHAVSKHGAEALAIRECVSNGKIHQQFKSMRGDDRYALLCEIPQGWGIQICGVGDSGLYECTSFVPKDGTWHKVTEYLSRNWTRFTGVLP